MRDQRFRKMNPAFAAAHGIQTKQSGSRGSSSGVGSSSSSSNDGNIASNNRSLEIVLKRARDTGKLVASNCAGLKGSPLPNEVFEFPFGTSNYTEELMTVVDFSDNEDQLGNSFIDERILNYRSVQSIRFRNCGMRIPDGLSFASFEKLTILDLSGNRLDRFDVGFLLCSLERASPLAELNLSNNQMREVVASSANPSGNPVRVNLPNLRTLNISHNPPLERLFEEGNGEFSCQNLRIFRCDHNPNLRVSSSAKTSDGLPSFLASAKATLEVLEASHNPKMALADDGSTHRIDLSGYSRLQTVSFALNRLDKIPCIPSSLKELNLRSNKVKSLEGMFSSKSPSSLSELILADNYLTRLDPSELEIMAKLQRMDLSSNKIMLLPYQLGFLNQLSTLNISGNPVVTKFSPSLVNTSNPRALFEVLRKRAPPDYSKSGVSATASKSPTGRDTSSSLLSSALSTRGRNTLDLAGKITENGFVALEGLVQEMKANSTVDRGITGQFILDSNKLQSIPEDLLSSCLPNVKTISLINNQFVKLPASLQSSRSRTVDQLYLRKNQLTSEALCQAYWFQSIASSPSSMSHGWSLNSLTHLDLSSNRLTSFPINTSSSIHCFPALDVLNLSNNKISSLHDWKRLPGSLTLLELSENKIEDIEPLAVLLAGDCPNFQRLSLMHNNIKRIPPTLGLLSVYAPSVISVKLYGNPQRSVRSSFVEGPCGRLLEYLSNRLTVEQREAAVKAIQDHKQGSPSSPSSVTPTRVSDASSEGGPSSRPMANEWPTLTPTNSSDSLGGGGKENDQEVLKKLQQSVAKFSAELENLSLTQAKKYAIKKALAMERSKLIREERRLGLRK